MSAPTVIRHIVANSRVHQVVTYFEGGQLRAAYQRYTVSGWGLTSLEYSMPYSTENGAIAAWTAGLYAAGCATG